jgi:hypothetical protein
MWEFLTRKLGSGAALLEDDLRTNSIRRAAIAHLNSIRCVNPVEVKIRVKNAICQ